LQRGGLILPAAGRISVRFNEINSFGTKNKGIVIQTRKQGVVVSPATGNVIFAGSFRGNSKVVIIKHHSPYHSVIMGMASLDIKTGDAVEAGEPIGKMGKQVLDLYLELRRNGEQVDPSPWLALKKNS
jgi:septal ring factor EnvC (AmiA/AmiB activator)